MQVLNSFSFASERPHPAAAAIADCPTALITSATALPVTQTAQDRMASAIMSGVVALARTMPRKEGARQPAFCREPGGWNALFGVYRPGASSEHFTMAMGDAGRAILVGRNQISEEAAKSAQARYTIAVAELDKAAMFGDFTALPPPEQVIRVVSSSPPIAVAGTWGKNAGNISIGAGK